MGPSGAGAGRYRLGLPENAYGLPALYHIARGLSGVNGGPRCCP
jgi:hypothetical protein